MVYTEEPNTVILDREAGARGGGARAARGLWRVAAAEACGTALLVALTCLPGAAPAPTPLLTRALGGALVVSALVQSFDHVSGAHFNPTVTLAALLARRVGAAHAAAALAAQVVGAGVGAALLATLAPAAIPHCVTRPAASVSVYQALGVEALLGAVLALANLAAWDARNAGLRDSWPLRIGATVAALSLAAGELTGASMNPLRSLAPALCAAHWHALWVYCVGPPAGACAASVLYACAWPAPAPPPRHPRAPS